MDEPFALYVHVPWCRHVCPYCDFNVYAARNPPEADYTTPLAYMWSRTDLDRYRWAGLLLGELSRIPEEPPGEAAGSGSSAPGARGGRGIVA